MNNYNLKKISIVMVNYNGLRYLRESIPSILEIDYPDFELIVVDNGSIDGSIEYLRGYTNKKFRLVQSPRLREKNFACNFAVKYALGSYILLVDNDILITNRFLLKDLLELYKNLQNVGCITLGIVNKGDAVSRGYGNFCSRHFTLDNKPLRIDTIKKLHGILIGHPSGIGIFMNRLVWEKVGGYDDFHKFGGDDNDLGIRLWIYGYSNYLYANTIQVHLGMPERADNIKYSLKLKEMVYAHLYVIVKNYSTKNMLISVVFYGVFALLKSIKQSVLRKTTSPFFGVFQAYALFFRNLPVAVGKRKQIQRLRTVKEDIFLKIRPPKIIS